MIMILLNKMHVDDVKEDLLLDEDIDSITEGIFMGCGTRRTKQTTIVKMLHKDEELIK